MRYSNNSSLIKTLFVDLKKDLTGSLIFQFRHLIIIFRFLISTAINRFCFTVHGVKLEKNSKFIGKCIVSRYPQSQIIFGNLCSFNSVDNVNLIGINHRCIISTQTREAIIKVGNNCGISGATLSIFKSLTIGNNVKIGANVLITDSNWHPEDPRSGEALPIVIGNNVWLGVNSVVLKGVSIGDNSIIGANCVVTKNIPPNSVVVGNPCRIVKTLQSD